VKLALVAVAGVASIIIIGSLGTARPAPRPAPARTLAERATRNGLPVDVQDLVDRAAPRRVGGRTFPVDRFAELRDRHDLSRALLERLGTSPYEGLGRDLADLEPPDRVLERVLAIARDRDASPASRREAIEALARISTPRVVLDGAAIGRTGDGSLWLGWCRWPPEGARVVRSPYRFDPELTEIATDAKDELNRAAAAALTSAIAAR
jgi:hypothetical protein